MLQIVAALNLIPSNGAYFDFLLLGNCSHGRGLAGGDGCYKSIQGALNVMSFVVLLRIGDSETVLVGNSLSF